MEQKYIDVLEKYGWNIVCHSKDWITIATFSNAREDIVVDLETEDISVSMRTFAKNFDVEEHVLMLLEAKRNRVRNVPDIVTLVHDAEEIQELLYNTAIGLREVVA